MSDQLDVFEATVRRLSRWRPPRLAPPTPPLDGPRDRAQWATWLLDEYVAAVSSERSCRCRGLQALDGKEKFALLERAAYHLARTTDLRAQLLAHTTYPELAPVKNTSRALHLGSRRHARPVRRRALRARRLEASSAACGKLVSKL